MPTSPPPRPRGFPLWEAFLALAVGWPLVWASDLAEPGRDSGLLFWIFGALPAGGLVLGGVACLLIPRLQRVRVSGRCMRWAALALALAIGFWNGYTRGLDLMVRARLLGSRAVPILIHNWGNYCLRARTATDELRRLGVEAVPGLVHTLLEDPDPGTVGGATRMLCEMGPAAASAVPALLEGLKGRERYRAGAAAEVLGCMGPAAGSAVPALMACLNDNSSATEALHSIGAPAAAAAPVLMENALKIIFPDQRCAAVKAVVKMGPEAASAALPVLLQALKAPDWSVRSRAADALGWMGASARAGVHELTEASMDSNEWVRKSATEALRTIQAQIR